MKMIDFEALFGAAYPNKVMDDANLIANRLICELKIPFGNSMACFLGVNPKLDNHQALRVWVQRRLAVLSSDVMDECYGQLQRELYECLPSSDGHFY